MAIVTGGAGGIGTATVDRLLKSGAKVAAFDRDQTRLDQLKAGKGDELSIHQVDVLSLDQIEQAVANVEKAFGRIDLLISVAGGGTPTTIDSAKRR